MTRILTYHAIEINHSHEEGSDLYCVPQANFRRQMEFLARNRKEFLLTFDDGDVSNFDIAYPILQALNLSAFFFVTASQVGNPGYMNWHQLSILKEVGMTIGSHGMTHTILAGMDTEQLRDEIAGSKKIIEEHIGAPVDYFSIAKGHYSPHIIEALRQTAYKAVFSSDLTSNDEFVKSRIAVRRNWDINRFMYVIDHGVPLKDLLVARVKDAAKKCLGPRAYHVLRSRALSVRKETA